MVLDAKNGVEDAIGLLAVVAEHGAHLSAAFSERITHVAAATVRRAPELDRAVRLTRVGVGIGEAERDGRRDEKPARHLDAIATAFAGRVGRERAEVGRIEAAEAGDLVTQVLAEIGDVEQRAATERAPLDAGIIAEARLGPQARVGLVVLRIRAELIIQARQLDAGAEAGVRAQTRFAPGVGDRAPPRRVVAEGVVVLVAQARR